MGKNLHYRRKVNVIYPKIFILIFYSREVIVELNSMTLVSPFLRITEVGLVDYVCDGPLKGYKLTRYMPRIYDISSHDMSALKITP